MLIIYGPKPGTEVTFPLSISPAREIDDGKGGKIKIPPKRNVGGNSVIKVTAKVPSEADRRAIDAHLARTTIESEDGKIRIVGSREAYDNWRAAALRKLIVRVEDLRIVDQTAPDDPAKGQAISTAEDLLTFADDDVLNAVADVVMDRIRLSEAIAGKFDGRSSSSPAAITAPGETAANADATGSAQPARVTVPPSDPTST